MAHLHITGWVVAFILLFIVTSLYKQDKAKQGKILHMILRLDYLIILFSGIVLFIGYGGNYGTHFGELIVKMLAGLWTIIAIEMITVRTGKGQSTKSWWIQFVIAALIAIILGFGRLPYGVLP